jgi:proline iminopeptidase
MSDKRSLARGAGRFQTSDGLSLWYRIAGRGPALLVPTPGWGASVDMYMKSLTPLEKDFSVVYLDTRGAGRSDAPAKPSGFRFHNFLDDIEALRTHLNLDRWLIFAHSDATLQALGYAIEHPKICHGLFIVCGTMHIDNDEVDLDIDARMKMLSREPWFAAADKPEPKTDYKFRRTFLHDQLPLYFASAEAARKARHFFSASTYRVKGNLYDEYAPEFPPKKLAKVHVPTAVFVGDSDVITTPMEAVRLAHSLPHSRLFMIRNAGHFPWLQQRNRFFKDFAKAARMVLKGRH